jgi:thiamine pyrophosphokinase
MIEAKASNAIVLLPSGSVALVGGFGATYDQSATQIFDPVTMTFSPEAEMITSREYCEAVTLKDGRILVVGGTSSTATILKSAELFGN